MDADRVMTRASSSRRLRVLVAGTFEPDVARNRVLLPLLTRAGYDVHTIRESIWGEKRYALVDTNKANLALRAGCAYLRLAWRLLRAPRPDVAIVLYPGYLDMPLVGLIGRLRSFPVVFDMFISLHDTVTGDRNLRAASSPLGRVARLVDTLACRSASLVMADTPAHADFFAALTDVPRARFRVLWVGAQESVFSPVADVEPDPDLVLFYGTFIPLQGIETIVRAAKLLEGSGVRVRIIGDGQERTRVERLVDELDASNIELVAPMPLEALPAEVARAALCLGIFGTTDKAARVVPTKLYEALAVGRPVLTGDSDAIRVACNGDVATVPPGDPTALADAIRDLLGEPERREALAAAGHARYQRVFSEAALTEVLARIVTDAVARRRRASTRD